MGVPEESNNRPKGKLGPIAKGEVGEVWVPMDSYWIPIGFLLDSYGIPMGFLCIPMIHSPPKENIINVRLMLKFLTKPWIYDLLFEEEPCETVLLGNK